MGDGSRRVLRCHRQAPPTEGFNVLEVATTGGWKSGPVDHWRASKRSARKAKNIELAQRLTNANSETFDQGVAMLHQLPKGGLSALRGGQAKLLQCPGQVAMFVAWMAQLHQGKPLQLIQALPGVRAKGQP